MSHSVTTPYCSNRRLKSCAWASSGKRPTKIFVFWNVTHQNLHYQTIWMSGQDRTHWTCHYCYGTGRILFKCLLLKWMTGHRYTSIKDRKLIKAWIGQQSLPLPGPKALHSACLERYHNGNLILSILIIQFKMTIVTGWDSNIYHTKSHTNAMVNGLQGQLGFVGKKKSHAPPGNSTTPQLSSPKPREYTPNALFWFPPRVKCFWNDFFNLKKKPYYQIRQCTARGSQD